MLQHKTELWKLNWNDVKQRARKKWMENGIKSINEKFVIIYWGNLNIPFFFISLPLFLCFDSKPLLCYNLISFNWWVFQWFSFIFFCSHPAVQSISLKFGLKLKKRNCVNHIIKLLNVIVHSFLVIVCWLTFKKSFMLTSVSNEKTTNEDGERQLKIP